MKRLTNRSGAKNRTGWQSTVRYDTFRSSSFCNGGACLVVARQTDGSVLVRDSKDLTRQTLKFTHSEWAAFVKGVKHNEFDVE